jgi:hypothetical protein
MMHSRMFSLFSPVDGTSQRLASRPTESTVAFIHSVYTLRHFKGLALVGQLFPTFSVWQDLCETRNILPSYWITKQRFDW